VEDMFEKKTFGFRSFGIIFQAIKEAVDSDLYPDIETVTTILDQRSLLDSVRIELNGLQGREALEFIRDVDVNVDALESYAFQILHLRANRQLLTIAKEIQDAVELGNTPIEILSKIDVETGKIAAYVGAQSKNTRTAKDVAQSNVEQLEDTINGKSSYISTYLKFWDDFVGGLFPRLYMIAAEQNEGKSSLVLNLIRNIAIQPPCLVKEYAKRKIKLFTFESSAEEINNKLVQMMTGISQLRIEKGQMSESELVLYKNALKEIADSPILYDDSPELTLPLLRTKIRKAVAEGAEAIFIDQLEQILIGGGGDIQQEHIRLNYITYRIKAYQRESNIPIVLVHQRKKAVESQSTSYSQQEDRLREPELNDLNQAGGKAPDAVAMIRTKKAPAIFWVKNRQGAKGKRSVNWDGSRILFSDISEDSIRPEFVQAELPQ